LKIIKPDRKNPVWFFLEKMQENLQKSLDISGLSCYSFMALRRQQVKHAS